MAEDPWYIEFNGAFWLTISASLFAFMGMALRACLKSRCTKINCCSSKGLLACEREPVADEFTDLEAPKTSTELRRTDTLGDLQEGNNIPATGINARNA